MNPMHQPGNGINQMHSSIVDKEVIAQRASMHPGVKSTAAYVRTLESMIGAHPSVLYAQAVLRPSLALAQGHALSLIQGLEVRVCEMRVDNKRAGYDGALRALLKSIESQARCVGRVCSVETGESLAKGVSTVGTVRLCVRDHERVLFVLLFSGQVILTHTFKGGEGYFDQVASFANLNEPREKGFIRHISVGGKDITQNKYENFDDGVILDEAYPFVDGMRAYVERFLGSASAILNLYGVGGTGKSTLMRKIATLASKRAVILVDNPLLYRDPGLSSSLMSHIRTMCAEGERPLVLFEEVDEYIKSKSDGNDFLVQLLSMSSGVLPLDIKVVLASNLKNTDSVLDVLQRNGRSFGSVEFIKMSPEQAVACRAAMGLPVVEFSKPLTLAEAICEKVTNVGTNTNRLGF